MSTNTVVMLYKKAPNSGLQQTFSADGKYSIISEESVLPLDKMRSMFLKEGYLLIPGIKKDQYYLKRLPMWLRKSTSN